MARWISASLGVFGVCTLLAGQSFEVASVRENVVGDPVTDYVPRRSGDRITMHNSQLVSIVAWAYGLTNSNYQLVAGRWQKELWEHSYDIEARAPGAVGEEDLRRMFQGLLRERFRLKVHRETRELAAYDLVVAGSGAKLTRAPVTRG